VNINSFILKRLSLAIFVIFGLSIVIFIIARIVPGDPARISLGPRAPEEVVQRLRHEMYLDKPLPMQYFYWVKGALSGDFGDSLITKKPVLEDVKNFFPATLELLLYTSILMIIFSIPLGTLAARYNNTWIDNLIRILSYFGIAIPTFVTAIMLMMLFGYFWPILPVIGRLSSGMVTPTKVTGLLTIDSLIHGNFVVFWDAIKHLIIPCFSLAWGRMLMEARITRSSMVDNLRKDYITAERGFGIPERVIISTYLLKPSIISTIMVMGVDFGSAFANAFLVESIFIWPGLSRYGLNAIMQKDLNVISAVILVTGTVIITINIIVDLIIIIIDPRIRLGLGQNV